MLVGLNRSESLCGAEKRELSDFQCSEGEGGKGGGQ